MIAVAVMCGYSAVLVLNVLWDDPGPARLVLCVACVTALFCVQLLLLSPRARHRPLHHRVLTLAVQAALAFVPFLWFGVSWAPAAGVLGASLLLLLPRPLAWALFALVAAGTGGYAALLGLPLGAQVYAPLTTVLTGLVLHGLTLLTDLVREVHTARAELARTAVAQERRRISRDVHDLLGYSLSAITLKCELIHRLVPAQPGRALDEVESVLAVSRQAVADARLVASGYREMSLAAEAESAAEVLAAADIRTTVDIACGRLHPAVDTVLATTLREGVTNILRHSTARTCDIRAVRDGETVRLVLVNDGVLAKGRSGGPRGCGLDNLRTRVDEVGGRLTAMVRDDGRFRLVAKVPVRPVTPMAATTAVRESA
ncbi:histidine kinase [Streptomyces niveiscabiei]|uniref:sensor histidine kinase n=1 Tax=Streptomyces niveiscabiei TaxID=164115 RepID=UPI0029BD477B|nr:histidine kinase [Streptomyces niveiscabiei]MDX3380076.1 histidine kinase [Streptomyces niveiscabiei]